MDNALLRKLASFKILYRKHVDNHLDISRIVSDVFYSEKVLASAEESDNEDLALLALEIKDALGLFEQPESLPDTQSQAGSKETPNTKYLYGVRN